MKTILAAALLLWLLAPPPASAQQVATLGEKSIGTACNNGADAVNFDTLAQCSATSGSGTFQKAPLFVGQVTSPPYATTACDAAKAGMLQYTASSGFQGCNGSAWSSLASGSLVGYERLGTDCYNCSTLSLSCSSGKKILGCEFSQSTYAGAAQFTTDTTCSGNTIGGSLQYLAMQITCAYASTGTGTAGYLGSSAAATSPSRADDITTGLFSATASTVSLATGGAERLRVTATGSVGIGVTAPGSFLTVRAPASAGRIATFESVDGTPYITLATTTTAIGDLGSAKSLLGSGGSTTDFGINARQGNLVFSAPDATERMRITATGSVGIGTTTPSERLDLGGGNIAAGLQVVQNTCASCNSLTATCPAGKYALGGGCASASTTYALRGCTPNAASGLPAGWTGILINNASEYMEVRVICANIK